jgi:hypothetical protein
MKVFVAISAGLHLAKAGCTHHGWYNCCHEQGDEV